MPDDNPTPTPSTTPSSEATSTSTPAPETTAAPVPTATKPAPANNGDEFAENQKKKKKSEEDDRIDTSKMDPMMAAMLQLYAKLGKTIEGFQDAVSDSLAPHANKVKEKISDTVDNIIDKIRGPDETLPNPDANNPKADSEQQASLKENAENTADNAAVPAAAPLAAFPDTPAPDPAKSLQSAEASGYDKAATPTPTPGDSVDPDKNNESQVGNSL